MEFIIENLWFFVGLFGFSLAAFFVNYIISARNAFNYQLDKLKKRFAYNFIFAFFVILSGIPVAIAVIFWIVDYAIKRQG